MVLINDETYLFYTFSEAVLTAQINILPGSTCDKCRQRGKFRKQRRRRVRIGKSTFILQKSGSAVNLNLIQARKRRLQRGRRAR